MKSEPDSAITGRGSPATLWTLPAEAPVKGGTVRRSLSEGGPLPVTARQYCPPIALGLPETEPR